jgi:hypothetical protein
MLTKTQYYANARFILAFWKSRGYTTEQACGWVANAAAESGLQEKAVGDKVPGTNEYHSYGLHQLQRPRCIVIAQGDASHKGCGIDVTTLPSLEEQLKAVAWELDQSERHARDAIKWAATAYDAGSIISQKYERPGAPGQAEKRGKAAQEWFEWFKANP